MRFIERPHYSCTLFLFLHLDHLSWLQMQYFRDFPRHHSRLVVLRASPHSFHSKDPALMLLAFAFNDENIWVIFLVLSLKEELLLLYHFGVCFVIRVHWRLNLKLHLLWIAVTSHSHIHRADIDLFLVLRKQLILDLIGDLKEEGLPVKKRCLLFALHLLYYNCCFITLISKGFWGFGDPKTPKPLCFDDHHCNSMNLKLKLLSVKIS